MLQLAGEAPSRLSAELFPRAVTDRADEGFLCLVQFPSGLVAHIEFNRGFPPALNTGWMLVGENASYAAGTQYRIAADGEVVDGPAIPPDQPAADFYHAVVRHLRAGGANPVPAEQARAAVELIEAARRAARTGLPQSLSG
jgi:predicted dehydrogenase